jgi:hypothetical protein
MRVSNFDQLVTAIKQEYFYAQRDKLLTGSLKTEFEDHFHETSSTNTSNIKNTEQKIFLCLKPLMPFSSPKKT